MRLIFFSLALFFSSNAFCQFNTSIHNPCANIASNEEYIIEFDVSASSTDIAIILKNIIDSGLPVTKTQHDHIYMYVSDSCVDSNSPIVSLVESISSSEAVSRSYPNYK